MVAKFSKFASTSACLMLGTGTLTGVASISVASPDAYDWDDPCHSTFEQHADYCLEKNGAGLYTGGKMGKEYSWGTGSNPIDGNVCQNWLNDLLCKHTCAPAKSATFAGFKFEDLWKKIKKEKRTCDKQPHSDDTTQPGTDLNTGNGGSQSGGDDVKNTENGGSDNDGADTAPAKAPKNTDVGSNNGTGNGGSSDGDDGSSAGDEQLQQNMENSAEALEWFVAYAWAIYVGVCLVVIVIIALVLYCCCGCCRKKSKQCATQTELPRFQSTKSQQAAKPSGSAHSSQQ